MENLNKFQPKESFIRLATGCPEVSVANIPINVRNITEIYQEASNINVSLITFPELSITGYSLGDLVNQTSLLEQAENGLAELSSITEHMPTAMIVGLPLQVGSRLYNCAAVLANGSIQGIVPKTYRPNYNEFYEQRWYDSWRDPNIDYSINGDTVPFGTDLIFDIGNVKCGVEICEDLWVLRSPSIDLASKGSYIIANPSASPEQIGKASYRKNLVMMQSAKMFGAYLYAGSDTSESTAETVMGGHQMISADGQIIAERQPFGSERIIVADIDIDHLKFDRRKHHAANMLGTIVVNTEVERQQNDILTKINRSPFLPLESIGNQNERLNSIIEIQAHGLARRLKTSKQKHIVLGLSGGLDSTLALLVAHKASKILGLQPHEIIHTITMPGPASSDETQVNAQELASQLGVKNEVIPIKKLVETELSALHHDGMTQDITYENVQARARTSLLFNYANQNNAIVLGTGDLSELALGWCTYNGDQQSHYNVNASIPKTLVRHLISHFKDQPEYEKTKISLGLVLDTVISPELTSTGNKISQSTEEIVGPYELHDFFLYHLIRWGDKPSKIQYLANIAFADTYTADEIEKWLEVFIKRFSQNQFKRENMPNGPKVGSVSLSPRGDWRMPPDMNNPAIWI